MTVMLSWHVQKFVVIWQPAMELQLSEVSIEFEWHAKTVSETGQETAMGQKRFPVTDCLKGNLNITKFLNIIFL